MNAKRHSQKIQQLTAELLSGPTTEFPRKIISKYYDLASTINQEMPSEKSEDALSTRQKQSKQKLTILLKQLKQSFQKFKQTNDQEIKKFTQVEYYMFEETERILLKYEPTIVDIVVEKINSIKRIFMNSERKESTHDHDDTNSSLSDKNESRGQKRESHESFTAILPKLNSHRKLPEQQAELTPKTFPNSWQRINFYYQNHRIDQAYSELLRFQKYRSTNQKNSPLTTEQDKKIETIKLEYKTMSTFYDRFSDGGYTFDKEEKGISLWYKIIGGKDVAIKVQAEIDITIENFLCIASEIDLFEDYIPFSYGTKELKQISRNQKIGTSKIYIPLLTDRETYFYAAAYDRLQTTGSIFFFSKTINEDLEYQQRYGFRVPDQSDLIRLEYKHYILEYTPITKTRGKIRMISSIDLKMEYLPMFIINKTARVFSFDYMKNYQTINKKFEGSKWDKIKHEKKEIYDYFKSKIDEYLEEKDSYGG